MQVFIEEARRKVTQLQRIETDSETDIESDDDEDNEVPIFFSRSSTTAEVLVDQENDIGFGRDNAVLGEHNNHGHMQLHREYRDGHLAQQMEAAIDNQSNCYAGVHQSTHVHDQMTSDAGGHGCIDVAAAIAASGRLVTEGDQDTNRDDEEDESATTTVRLDDEALGIHLDALLERLECMSPDEIERAYGNSERGATDEHTSDDDNEDNDNTSGRSSRDVDMHTHAHENGLHGNNFSYGNAGGYGASQNVLRGRGNSRRPQCHRGGGHRRRGGYGGNGIRTNGHGTLPPHTSAIDSESDDEDDDEDDPVLREVREHNARVLGRNRG